MIVGNDISRFQIVDWNTYKNNTNFVIMKATEGISYIDGRFFENQTNARKFGIPLGYYHFARPDLGNSATAEAAFFLKTLGTLQAGEILALDYEPAGQNQSWVDWCKTFLDYVYAATKVQPLIYLNQAQVKQFNWKSVIDAGYGLWIAAYTYDPTKNNFEKGQWPFAAMQQWTNKQSVPGISGTVDGDVFFGDIATFKRYGYKSPTPQPSPCEQEVADLKKQVNDLQQQISTYKSGVIAIANGTIDLMNQALSKINELKK